MARRRSSPPTPKRSWKPPASMKALLRTSAPHAMKPSTLGPGRFGWGAERACLHLAAHRIAAMLRADQDARGDQAKSGMTLKQSRCARQDVRGPGGIVVAECDVGR